MPPKKLLTGGAVLVTGKSEWTLAVINPVYDFGDQYRMADDTDSGRIAHTSISIPSGSCWCKLDEPSGACRCQIMPWETFLARLQVPGF
jgi:hypothetical protein